MKKNYCIAVTGLNAIDSPGPGIPVIRGIRDSKLFDSRIIGFAYESLEPGIYMHDVVDKTYQIPYPSSGTDSLLERLNYIHSIEKIDIIIPNFDAELYSFIKLEKTLNSMGIKLFLPTMEQFEERHKVNLPAFGKKYGIKVPFSREIFNISDIFGLTRDFTYPIVVKGKYYDAYIAYSAEQAQAYFNKIASKWGLPIVIQEFIKGTEYNVTGLGDGKGNTVAAVAMRKQYITDKGKAWGGITIEDSDLLGLTHNFLSKTKWRGGFELEMMKSSKNEYYLLEINPRIPAWIYLAVGAGQNIPEALVRLALGEDVEHYKTYTIGKMFIRYSWDMIVDIDEFQKISTYGEL